MVLGLARAREGFCVRKDKENHTIPLSLIRAETGPEATLNRGEGFDRARARVFVCGRTKRPSLHPGSAPTYRRRWWTRRRTGICVQEILEGDAGWGNLLDGP